MDNRPLFTYNAIPPHIFEIFSPQKLGPGKHQLVIELTYDGGGAGKGADATMLVNGEQVARGRLDKTIARWISHTEGFDVGADTTSPVSARYQSPAEFTGEVNRVTIDLK